MKTYNVQDVAKRFLMLAHTDCVSVTHMKLQKLVFFGQLVALKSFDGTPLHSSATYAWDYGPVVRELYDRIRRFGSSAISLIDNDGKDVFPDAADIDDTDAEYVINATWNKFNGWDAFQLSMLTHRPNSPWSVCYSRERSSLIPNDLIRSNGFGDNWNV